MPMIRLIRPGPYSRVVAVTIDYFRLWPLIADSGFSADDLEEDMTVWTLEPSGEYTARSARVQYSLAGNMDRIFWLRFLETVSFYPPQALPVATAEESLEFGQWAVLLIIEWVNCRPLCGRNSRNGRPSYLVMPSSPDVFGTAH